ncbi:MAG: exosortase E/protease, VPEID-CTERM system [Methylomonas sp.]
MASEYAERIHTLTISKQLAFRWFLLLTLLTLELATVAATYQVPPLLAHNVNWSAWVLHFSNRIWSISLCIAGACVFILHPRIGVILCDLKEQARVYRCLPWLLLHLIAFATFVAVTSLIFKIPVNPDRLSAPWFVSWFMLASSTWLLWLLTLAPGDFWLRLIRHNQTALLMAFVLGICTWMLIGMVSPEVPPFGQKEFWSSLAIPTLQLSHSLLGWFYADLVYQPERYLLGTASFQVIVSYGCSGIAGIALITLFLAIYLWLFRKELCFPQVFWLFPLGIILIWLANVVRIAMLIAIGTSFSPVIALKGFHAQAGWIAFTLIALGAIALSNRMRFFTLIKTDLPDINVGTPFAAALLLPLLVMITATMVTSAFSSGFDVLYPLRVVATGIVLCYFRKSYNSLGWKWSWRAPAIGTAVFLIWIMLEPNIDNGKTTLTQGLAELTSEAAAVWLVFRALGSVIAVPLAEELAFRGYLIRKLIAKDFENIPLGQFSWLSFILTSVLFGLLHERWLAGTLAGMSYALAIYRRGQMGDAVIAHMTTNALIAIFILTQGRWSLWS